MSSDFRLLYEFSVNLRKDRDNVQMAIILDSCGQSPRKRLHPSKTQLEQKLLNLCYCHKTMEQTMRGLGNLYILTGECVQVYICLCNMK